MRRNGELRGRTAQRVRCTVEIRAPVDQVFDQWSCFEQLPQLVDGVRRTRRIDERRILWDAEVAGRQVVWEAEIVELVPGKRISWESRWGAPNAGEVSFDELPGDCCRMTVDIVYQPRGPAERLGSRLGLLRSRIQRDLVQFRRFVESLAAVGELG